MCCNSVAALAACTVMQFQVRACTELILPMASYPIPQTEILQACTGQAVMVRALLATASTPVLEPLYDGCASWWTQVGSLRE